MNLLIAYHDVENVQSQTPDQMSLEYVPFDEVILQQKGDTTMDSWLVSFRQRQSAKPSSCCVLYLMVDTSHRALPAADTRPVP